MEPITIWNVEIRGIELSFFFLLTLNKSYEEIRMLLQ